MLAGEPFHLRPWEIARLTPYQVRAIYCHERDPQTGNLVLAQKQRPMSYKEQFYFIWRKRGLVEHRIDDKWQAYQAEQQAKKKEKKGKRR